ncbi:hypothetical protein BKA56DRAFT_555774 [Ilyonectria sp. MPI-CAGE-AT-0026]|nr:hypothetical protein BKA56DRAFT_555774 [Ilyonectria sp. MPI-CAGE-AT-0026]
MSDDMDSSSTTQQGEPQPASSARRPFWLSNAALVLFCLLFLTCAASLITLDRLIASRDGLALTISSSSYSWTYGPTAILVVILSFWRRVDYYYKSLQPWRELWAGPVPADKSLLLDYITPFQGTSMIRAIKNGHYAVAATIFSFFLLKLIILVSTALFVVAPSLHAETFAIQYENKFDAADAWASLDYSARGNNKRCCYDSSWRYKRGYGAFSGGSDASVWAYLEKLNEGTTNNTHWNPQNGLVTQSFRLQAVEANASSLEAPVDMFIPRISCEDAILSISDPASGSSKFDFESATCSADGGVVEPCFEKGNDPDASRVGCPEVPRTYTLFRLNCSSGHDKSDKDINWDHRRFFPEDYEPYDIRYAITATKHEMQTLNSTIGGVSEIPTDPVKYSSIICKIGYGILSDNATLDPFTGKVGFPDDAFDGETKRLHNLSSIALTEMLLTNLGASTSLVVDTKLLTESATQSRTPPSSPLFQLMFAKLGYPDDLDIFHQPSVLKDTFVSVLGGISTEFARQSLLVGNGSEGLAKGLVSEDRLYARPFALWAMSPTEKNEKETGPWSPLAARLPMVVTVFTVPIVAIVVLGLLQRLSDQRHGLVNMNDSDMTANSYIVRIASTLLVFAIATMIDSLDSTITVFAPYSSLRSGNARVGQSILFHLLSVSPFLILVKSLRNRHYGPAASHLSSLIASSLTIIVSGLWVVTDPMSAEQASTAIINHWDSSWLNNPLDDGGAAIRLNSIRRNGTNTPLGIWKDVVVPKISLPSSSVGAPHGTNYTYEILALQPVLNCTVVPQQDINVSSSISASAVIPRECSSSWIGGTASLSYAMEIGMATKVPLTITYNGDPILGEISSDQPPRFSPEKAQSLRNGTNNAHTFRPRLGGFMEGQFFPFDHDDHDAKWTYDSFFNHLLYGPNGQLEEELEGSENTKKLIRAVTREYSEYMRHVIDLNFRAGSNATHINLVSTANGTSSPVPSAANTEVSGIVSKMITRLAIHRTSRLILQILLAVMTGFGFLGYSLVKLRGTLPRDPSSIASTMAFLADSQLCDRRAGMIPHGAEFMSDQQLKRVFDRRVFSLGWWMTAEGEASAVATDHARFGVDVGESMGEKYKASA